MGFADFGLDSSGPHWFWEGFLRISLGLDGVPKDSIDLGLLPYGIQCFWVGSLRNALIPMGFCMVPLILDGILRKCTDLGWNP